MARHCIREPRYVPPVQRIGEQPDLFGGPTLSHVAERQGPPKGWQRQLQKWGRCTVIADLEAAPPSVLDPPPSPSPVFLVACVAAHLDRPAPARALRSDARRVGQECVRTCRSRWSPYHYNNNEINSNSWTYPVV